MDLEGTNEDTGSSIPVQLQELVDSHKDSFYSWHPDQQLDFILIMSNFVMTSSNQITIAQNTERIATINRSKWVILIIIYTFNLID